MSTCDIIMQLRLLGVEKSVHITTSTPHPPSYLHVPTSALKTHMMENQRVDRVVMLALASP